MLLHCGDADVHLSRYLPVLFPVNIAGSENALGGFSKFVDQFHSYFFHFFLCLRVITHRGMFGHILHIVYISVHLLLMSQMVDSPVFDIGVEKGKQCFLIDLLPFFPYHFEHIADNVFTFVLIVHILTGEEKESCIV